MRQKNTVLLASLAMTLVIIVLPRVTAGQDRATPQEVVDKVREAAGALSKTGDLAQFNQRQGPWVWKDTYIFVEDCEKKVLAAHPLRPDLIGQSMASAKDARGKSHYPDLTGYYAAAMKPAGVWLEYWWAKPGHEGGSRKVSYNLAANETPYVVAAGVYDDKLTIAELSELTATKWPTSASRSSAAPLGVDSPRAGQPGSCH